MSSGHRITRGCGKTRKRLAEIIRRHAPHLARLPSALNSREGARSPVSRDRNCHSSGRGNTLNRPKDPRCATAFCNFRPRRSGRARGTTSSSEERTLMAVLVAMTGQNFGTSFSIISFARQVHAPASEGTRTIESKLDMI